MSGLNEIIGAITADGDNEASQILAAARKKAEEMIAQGAADADHSYDLQLEKTALACEKAIANAQSGADADAGRAMLAARVEAVRKVMDAALEQLHLLPDADYFAMIKKLILQYARPGEGVLVLSARDAGRIPTDFLEDVSAALDAKGATIAMCGDCPEMGDGFLLRYGEIEQNCLFSAILDERSSDIKDAVARILFGGGEAQ